MFGRYERGAASPGAAALAGFAAAGADIAYVLTGKMQVNDLLQGQYLASDDAKRLLGGPRAGITRLPVYDLRASAGSGAVTDSTPEHLGDYEVSSELLRRVWNLQPGSTWIFIVQGPSMEPDFRSGEAVFADTSAQRVTADGFYVFEIGDERFFKELQRLPKNRLKVISRNPMYEPWFIEPEQLPELKIMGHVKVHGRLV